MHLREFTQDIDMLHEVFVHNEYQLPAQFPPGSVVLDIGAHIGCFALACLQRGAVRVVCYEPDWSSFHILQHNTAPYRDVVEVHHAAVWRSDRAEVVRVIHDANPIGTAVSQVRCGEGNDVTTVSLDSVLDGLPPIDLCKIDCEGAEYPLLFTSRRLHRIRKIVVETHRAGDIFGLPMDLPWPCDAEGVAACLREAGFRGRITAGNDPAANQLVWGERGASA